MKDQLLITPIGYIESPYPEKFGVPRQSGRVNNISTVKFIYPYDTGCALKGLEGYSHIWLIWGFSENPKQKTFQPTVRPPRLGGNSRRGVFATRSPNRPNPLGLSLVKIIEIKAVDKGSCIIVDGADLVDGTPIYDVKPYLPCEAVADALGGFSDDFRHHSIEVHCPAELKSQVNCDTLEEIISILAEDPVPAYQSDPERLYGISYKDFNITFHKENDTAYIESIKPIDTEDSPA